MREAAVVLLRGQGRADGAHHQHQPDDHADDEQDLPHAAELDVLVALVSEQEAVAAERAHDRQVRAGQRAEHDHHHGDEQAPHQLALCFGSRPTKGPMKRPAARKQVAIKKMASCRCQVRTAAYGRILSMGMPRKLRALDGVVAGQRAQDDLDHEQGHGGDEVGQGGLLARRGLGLGERRDGLGLVVARRGCSAGR